LGHEKQVVSLNQLSVFVT